MDLMKNVLFIAIHLHYYYLIFNESLIEGYEYFRMIQAKRKGGRKRKLKVIGIHAYEDPVKLEISMYKNRNKT